MCQTRFFDKGQLLERKGRYENAVARFSGMADEGEVRELIWEKIVDLIDLHIKV
jgi:hypothetical protein